MDRNIALQSLAALRAITPELSMDSGTFYAEVVEPGQFRKQLVVILMETVWENFDNGTPLREPEQVREPVPVHADEDVVRVADGNLLGPIELGEVDRCQLETFAQVVEENTLGVSIEGIGVGCARCTRPANDCLLGRMGCRARSARSGGRSPSTEWRTAPLLPGTY